MKKFKLFLIYLMVTLIVSAQEGIIGSFNTFRLGQKNKDYVIMAELINFYDIVGLIEVMEEEGVEELVDALEDLSGEKWGYHISPYSAGRGRYREYFAYVWRKSRVKFLKERGYYQDIHEDFLREPYGADFKIGEFDFTFVLCHSIFGKGEAVRRAEAFKLDEVYDYFQDLDPNENDIIMAGDFNLSPMDEAFEKLLGHKDKIIYTISPMVRTTIGRDKLVNPYDNMFLSTIYTKEFRGKSGALDFTQKQYEEMKDKVSDHLPIFIVVETDEDDD